ncbi:WecB/TagA/CpsF family glycosyltransferase [Candidatus Gottesmanbacteria bacterium]|nr:WecB/TagA/CpsF family glycosyltransferase [Candidatus Gottesmanbacteria bacterium]
MRRKDIRLARSYSPKAKTRTRLAPSPALAPGVDLLFVALGAPKQEEFIHKVKSQKSKVKINCKVAMGVGGAFDLINGRLKRAPRIWQELGIEWLWRLIQEPRRIQRIITATIIFPLLIFKSAILSLWQNKNH